METNKVEYYRQLYSLNEVSDNEEDTDASELKEILCRNNHHEISQRSASSPCSVSSRPSLVTRRIESPARRAPLIQRTFSAPVSGSGSVKETPLLRSKSSLLLYDTSAPSSPPEASFLNSFVIKETPAEQKQPERSLFTPNIGSVVMKNSNGIVSMLSKNNLPTKKRKRLSKEKPIELVAKGERIFANQTFFYIPNDDNAPLRRKRIEKAIRYGATWSKEWVSSITHVVVDKPIEYEDVMKYLKSINLDRLPSNIILVNEDYPMDCTMYPSLLDPGQHRYSIRGQITEAQVQENLFQEPAQSPQSLKVKSGRPPKSSDVHIEQTPPRSTSGTQVGEPEENLPLLVPAELCTDGQGSVTQEVPTFVRQNDDLDEMISVALKIQHLPLDDDDDDDADRLASPDDQGDPRYSDEEEHGNPHAKKIRQKPGKRGNFHQDGFSCMKGGTGVILSSNPNKQTISILEEMSEYYSRTRDEWRTRAYRQAIGTLKKQTRKIATYDDALALPMIGHRLATKIEEIALTNRLRRLDNTKLDPSDQSLQIFTKVYNAGFQVAFRWVQAGYKSLDDLMAHANLTARQRIGIEHYDDFNTRIPRDEVTALGDIVKKAAARINPSVTVMIMGSYRRGAATSGDIDLMLTKPGSTSSQDLLPFLSTLIDQLTRDGFLVCALAEPRGDGGSKWHGACVLPGHNTIWRRIDFLLVPETQMGAALIYFTGDDIFNRSIRLLSSKKGMRLNQEGLFKDVMRGPGRVKLNEGTLVEGADEKKIFEILGVPWRPPEQRILH